MVLRSHNGCSLLETARCRPISRPTSRSPPRTSSSRTASTRSRATCCAPPPPGSTGWTITEPLHGSDHFSPGAPFFRDPAVSSEVTASSSGDEFVIRGRKSKWVSNGTIATHAVVYLGMDASRGMAGGGVAFVPLNIKGVTKEPPLDKLGLRALNQGSMTFDSVRIPKRYVIADP